MPPQPARPAANAREYTSHVYALNTFRASGLDLESGMAEFETALVNRRESHTWPMQAIVSIGAQAELRRIASDLSTTSTGLAARQIDPPVGLLDRVEARGPGTYRYTITNIIEAEDSHDSIGSALEKQDTIEYTVERVDEFKEMMAGQEYMDCLLANHPLPAVHGPQWLNRLRYDFLSTYRRLFSLVLLVNLVTVAVMAKRAAVKPALFTYRDATTAVAVNLFVGTAMRHEHCVNMLFRIATSIPHEIPLCVRRPFGKIYCYGGVHSGCGVSAASWYILFTVLMIKQWDSTDAKNIALAAISGLMIFLFAILIGFAHPTVRAKYHNQWEMSHRFGGWTAIAATWTQVVILLVAIARQESRNFGLVLISSPAFWFLTATTAAIVYPWLRLRRREFTAEKMSNHAVRLHFKHQRRLTACVGCKLSDVPLLENHGFATIPEPNGAKGYSVIVAKAGDWTKKLAENPPKYLWMRGAPTIGVVRVAHLFRRIIIVATGSGIGPCLSFLQVRPRWPCRIIWSAPWPEATYGKAVMAQVFKADPAACVIDTKETGRPSLSGIVYSIYKETEAEAVVIISNPKVTKEVVYAMETRKVPAYGAIFDS